MGSLGKALMAALSAHACATHVAVSGTPPDPAPRWESATASPSDAGDDPDGTYLVPPPRRFPGARGYLSVICIPGCDAVYVDDEPLGPSPIFKHPTALGEHHVRLVSLSPRGTRTVVKTIVADAVGMIRESFVALPKDAGAR